MKLTAERLKELLEYDPETGIFRWLVKQNNRMKVGQVAGTGNGRGYMQIRIDGVKYRTHRLVWMYMTGEWPPHELDHINGDRSDNRHVNLRASNRSHNLQNRREASVGTQTGLLGVSVSNGKYVARINVSGDKRYLGRYDTPEEAYNVYLTAKRKYHEGCTI